MLTMPAVTPVMMPEDEPARPIAVLLLVHEPPAVASASVIDAPAHTLLGPVIGAVVAVMVSVVYTLQPPSV